MRISAIVTRIMQQMRRDKRTLALLFIAPLIILSLMYFIFNSNEPKMTLVVTNGPAPFIEKLKAVDVKVVENNDYSSALLKKEQYDGWLAIKQNNINLTLLNDDPSSTKAVIMKLSQALQPEQASRINLKTEYVYGDENTAIFDIFSPMLTGFFVFFFVFLITGIALLKERTSGTLERLLATPIKRSEIVAGYMIGYGFCLPSNHYYRCVWHLYIRYCSCWLHLACFANQYCCSTCFIIVRGVAIKLCNV